jgi:tetratricopeptide (TPR) repeat protein
MPTMDAAASAREALDEGIRAHDEGRYQDALAAFEKSASLQATARALNNAGMALLALHRRDEAEAAFERALGLDARHALANFNLARLISTRDPTRAFALAEAAVQADPANSDAWLLVTDLLRHRRDYGNAMRAVNLAIERAPQRAGDMDDARRDALGDGRSAGSAQRIRRGVEPFPGRPARRDGRHAHAAAGIREPRPPGGVARRVCGGARAIARGGAALPVARCRRGAERPALDQFLPRIPGTRRPRAAVELRGFPAARARTVRGRAAGAASAPPHGGTRVRVGFLSHYFYNCVVGRYFASWVKRLDAARFERVVYYTNAWVADDTRAIQASADTFRHVAGLTLASIARR